MNKICFREEAKDWNEALPIGNGFLGAMVFGKTGTERLQINEDSVWTGSFMEQPTLPSDNNEESRGEETYYFQSGRAQLPNSRFLPLNMKDTLFVNSFANLI